MLFKRDKIPDELVRNKILTIRLNTVEEQFLQSVMTFLTYQRGSGSSSVTKTEAIQILLSLGIEAFMVKNGDPREMKVSDKRRRRKIRKG